MKLIPRLDCATRYEIQIVGMCVQNLIINVNLIKYCLQRIATLAGLKFREFSSEHICLYSQCRRVSA